MFTPWKTLVRWTRRPTRLNSGQAIVLIAVGAVGLIAIMGLAIDAGRLLVVRRDAQTTATAASLSAARALCVQNAAYLEAGQITAKANGFENGHTNEDGEIDEWVTIEAPPSFASFEIKDECKGCFVGAVVRGDIPPSFIGLVYSGELRAEGSAIATCGLDLDGSYKEIGLRALWSMSTTCNNTVDFTGSSASIQGGVHSNNEIHTGAGGGGYEVIGPSSYAGDGLKGGADKITWVLGDYFDELAVTPAGQCDLSCFEDVTGGSDTDNPRKVDPQTEYPLDHPIEDYQPGGFEANKAEADGGGKYYHYDECSGPNDNMDRKWLEDNGLIDADDNLKDGLYYSDCGISIGQGAGSNGFKGKVTLVALGEIKLVGSGSQLTWYTDELLMYSNAGEDKCTASAVTISQSESQWVGNIFAPHGQVSMSLSSNSSTKGCVVANSINLSGSDATLVCEPEITPPDPGVWLAE
jgi:hypothetical protein